MDNLKIVQVEEIVREYIEKLAAELLNQIKQSDIGGFIHNETWSNPQGIIHGSVSYSFSNHPFEENIVGCIEVTLGEVEFRISAGIYQTDGEIIETITECDSNNVSGDIFGVISQFINRVYDAILIKMNCFISGENQPN